MTCIQDLICLKVQVYSNKENENGQIGECSEESREKKSHVDLKHIY